MTADDRLPILLDRAQRRVAAWLADQGGPDHTRAADPPRNGPALASRQPEEALTADPETLSAIAAQLSATATDPVPRAQEWRDVLPTATAVAGRAGRVGLTAALVRSLVLLDDRSDDNAAPVWHRFPVVAAALRFLLSRQRDDGAFTDPGTEEPDVLAATVSVADLLTAVAAAVPTEAEGSR